MIQLKIRKVLHKWINKILWTKPKNRIQYMKMEVSNSLFNKTIKPQIRRQWKSKQTILLKK